MLDDVIGVVHLDAHLCGARAHIQLVQHERHAPLEGPARVGPERDRRRSTDPHKIQILLRNVGNHPNVRQVGDAVQLLTGPGHLAFDDTLLHHDTRRRCTASRSTSADWGLCAGPR